MSNKKWVYNGVEFKVGDTVKVMQKTPSHAPNGMGEGIEWRNSWNSGLDCYLGAEGVIYSIEDSGCWLESSSYGYPLASLKKVTSATVEDFVDAGWVDVARSDPLPSGDFELIDKHGTVYEVYEGVPDIYTVRWSLPIAGATTVICMSTSSIQEGIASGFWKVAKTAEQLAKEARVANLMMQHESLLARHDILINEINELEEQIDKENS
jgi:hypothetical protein